MNKCLCYFVFVLSPVSLVFTVFTNIITRSRYEDSMFCIQAEAGNHGLSWISFRIFIIEIVLFWKDNMINRGLWTFSDKQLLFVFYQVGKTLENKTPILNFNILLFCSVDYMHFKGGQMQCFIANIYISNKSGVISSILAL